LGDILKDNAVFDINDSIQMVVSGKHYPFAFQIPFNYSRQTGRLKKQASGLELQTKTEGRIMKLISEEKTSKEIGEFYSSTRAWLIITARTSAKN